MAFPPTQYLFVQNQQWKPQNNGRNLFKDNIEENFSIVDFKQSI